MDSLGLLIFVMLLCFQWTAAPATKNTTWTYSGLVGQSEWSRYFPDCGGTSQSPVDVVTTKTKFDPSLIPLTPRGYSQHNNNPFTLYNNGHTAVIELPEWMGLEGLPWFFTAVQMHLHWGSGGPSYGGSEHTINGLSADAELHVVHYNSELYPSMATAMTQSDGMAVLGILIVLMKMETILYSSKVDDDDRIQLQDNYRKTQPLNARVVFTSFSAESGKELSPGEVTAIVIGVMCGCVGLAVIIRFIVKTIRFLKLLNHETVVVNSSTSSWDVLPSNRPTSMSRMSQPEKANEKKQDMALNSTSEAEKKEESLASPQTEP
ncbi:carbonic anhydrase 14 isoform X7 [Channa argus]|uniref:carbonic anhydrase 14 isoform X7 n=1 Tax=Channa argus TaxID=215402 RepID=UPI00352251FD